MPQKKEFITLKEAAKISGYSSDYIGQLIRKGKLEGKQVFSNIAWVTTEEAIRGYIEKDRKNKAGNSSRLDTLKKRVFSDRGVSKIFKAVLYTSIFFLTIFSLLLLYIFSVGIDKNIEQKALENLKSASLGSETSK